MSHRLFLFRVLFPVLILGCSAYGQQVVIPPDQPANLIIRGNQILLIYQGNTIFRGTIHSDVRALDIRKGSTRQGKAVSQVIKFSSTNDSTIRITGVISARLGSFPCMADRLTGAAPDIVRSSLGPSHSLLNRAVYDRTSDWVLSVDNYAAVRIIPGDSPSGRVHYDIRISGNEIILRFRPAYYRYHRGLSYFQPWTYQPWQGSVAGWCSWFAYQQDIDEQKIRHTADVLSAKLLPFGLDYLQIDDGYEQDQTGFPGTWLKPNGKFPSGLESLAAYIRSRGLIPGIWSNLSFEQKDSAFAHPGFFVRNELGEPAWGNWINYILDGSNPGALDSIIRPRFRGFRDMGWSYFKVDALRHLRYEGYNSYPAYFRKKHADPVEAYRNVLKAIREETGNRNFLLACWGIRPELVGLIDGCRIGNDGYCWQELAQYNSFNNVIWRNDPDHMSLSSKDAYLDCMLTSMTGSLYMLTDKPEYYDTGNLEPALRTLPVLFTQPDQLYDVDPSRSDQLDRVSTELSGSGPRVFDASCGTPYDLFSEEINTPYESWLMLGRAADSRKQIKFQELGLDPGGSWLVFEFWTKQFLGSFQGGFRFPSIDSFYRCQLFCLRHQQDHPQLLATSRHITCGALELEDLLWSDNILSGKSRLTGNDKYTLYIHEDSRYRFRSFDCKGAVLVSNRISGEIREITILSPSPVQVSWELIYGRD